MQLRTYCSWFVLSRTHKHTRASHPAACYDRYVHNAARGKTPNRKGYKASYDGGKPLVALLVVLGSEAVRNTTKKRLSRIRWNSSFFYQKSRSFPWVEFLSSSPWRWLTLG